MWIRKGETDNNDAAAKSVAEVDAFGEGAADYSEEEGAAAGAGCDCGAVGCEDGVCGCFFGCRWLGRRWLLAALLEEDWLGVL